MHPRMSSIEFRDTLALAQALHCQCSELSGPYAIASKNLRALHNALEKVFEIFDHAPVSHEGAALVKAVRECERVLNAIDHALGYQDRQPLTNNKTNVKFTARIETATNKVLKAHGEFMKHASENTTLASNPVSSYHPSAASKPSCELEGSTDTVSDMGLLNIKYTTGMAASNMVLESSGRVLPVAVERIPLVVRQKDLTQMSPVSFDSWKLPFALADPMASDIETASYLILAGDTANASQIDAPATATVIKRARESVHVPHRSVPEHSQDLAGRSTHISNRPKPISVNSKPKYRVVNVNPLERGEDSSDITSEDGVVSDEEVERKAPTIPKKNSRRTLRQGSASMANKRMARVFTRECDDEIDLECENSSLRQTYNNVQSSQPKECSTPPHPHPDGDGDVDLEATIIQSWNVGDMDRAEVHLESLLIRRPRFISPDVNRRIRHLLGVISSLKGFWEQALSHFVSILTTPLLDPSQLDAGDCAAACWIGDIYTVLDRRAEALIAYSIVEQGLLVLVSDDTNHYEQLLSRIKAERKICQDGNDKLSFELQLDRQMQCSASGANSILNPAIISRNTAQKFLELTPWSLEYTYPTCHNQSRAMGLSDIDPKHVQWQNLHKLQLSNSAFTSSALWPMPFDPLFASANIACGLSLSLSSERDLLHLKDIPRTSGALSRRRMNCFTCQDLRWLIKTLRACMDRLELKFTESANSAGTWLIPQYSFTAGSIVSTHFISISIFRLTFRSGYGLEICPGGIFSSRITSTPEGSTCSEVAGQAPELKRIKQLIRSYMDAALRRQEAVDGQNTVIPVVSINGVTSLHMKTSSKGKRPESETLNSPASSSRSESLFS